MNSLKSLLSLAFLSGVLLLASCGEDDPKPALEATVVENLAADPPTGYGPMGQPLGTTGKFKLFSFATGEIVANADSATSNWDIGFRSTTIIVNSGTSGLGTAAAQVVDGIFDEYFTAPDAGYKADDKNASPAYAIPTGSGNGWYTAAGNPTVITPIAGKIIVVKTADGNYAKFEILSYYKDAPTTPTGTEPARYYTFRYIHQPDGSKSFK